MGRVTNISARGFFPGLALAAILCGLNAPGVRAAEPLTRLRDVLDLPRPALATNPPVQVRAVVTCVDKTYKMVFVQDASAGIFVFDPPPGILLSPGDEIDIRGTAGRGLFSPIVTPKEITMIGKRNLPIARPVPLASLISEILVGERLETEGVVQRVQKYGDHAFISLVAGEVRCAIVVPISEETKLPDMLDARVRVRGVAASELNRQKQLVGFQIFANSLDEIEIVHRPAVEAFQAPICPIADLCRYAGRRMGEHRVHMRGIVTLHWPGRATVIQDSSGGVLLEKGVALEVKPGDELDVVGFPGPFTGPDHLRNAEARKVGPAAEPQAASAVPAEAAARENVLVRMVGRVVEWQPTRDGVVTALLSSSNDLFAAVLPVTGAQREHQVFSPGSVIAAIGVMRSLAGETHGTPRAALWLRGPADLHLLQPAPSSPWRWTILAASVATVLALAGGAVIAVLLVRHHRTTNRISARQSEAEQRFEEMERQLHRSHQDRQRIAQELHDNIIQSLYSMGLGIDEAIRLGQKNPERVQERLSVAVQSLNGIIRDVRAFLVGLEPKGLEGHELKAALKSVLLTSGEDQQARFSIQIDANAARDLNSGQATEVFNIAKEAMSNSMRHAQASLTKVSLVPYGRGVRLEVFDDGLGFDPAQVNGDSHGLRNLRSRARNIGAQLEIVSTPGEGTRIVLDIPFSHDNP